jgi:multidrug efflux pump subunit AcrB
MMWFVRLALDKRYTFIVMALFILLMSVVVISRMATDILPEINIPVVSIVWGYGGMSPEDMEKRVVLVSERAVTTTVNDVEHIESQSMRGVSIIKVFFHPNAKIEAAVAQITAVMQAVVRVLPPGITPPFIIRYNASSVPILQLSLNSKSLSEQELFDYGTNFIRTQLATVQGASIPTPLGGKARQIMVDLNTPALQAKGLSANDVVNAINLQNLILPAGTAKIGRREYDVALNNGPTLIEEMNDYPIKQVNGATIFIKDVAQVHDGYSVQTNVVREDGVRGALLTVLKAQGASTLDIVQRIKDALPRVSAIVPRSLHITPLFDQSVFVRASINGVLREGVIAACLTAAMILIFLGSLRSTFIVAVSIPLSILTSIICLFLCGETLNVMTLGGLGLAIGMLVDDATVEIENIHRNMHEDLPMRDIILHAAQQVATPALVSTLSICIVFFPVVLISGAARALFVPLAMAVVFAMLASYVLSRTLVPILALLLIKPHQEQAEGLPETGANHSFFDRLHIRFNEQFEKMRNLYAFDLQWAIGHRGIVVLGFIGFFLVSAILLPFIGEDFFPAVDAGQIRLHVRAPDGTRIEETERRFSQVDDVIRQVIPAKERRNILDNIGLPNSGINLAFGDNATIGTSDGEILVSLVQGHHISAGDYVKRLRRQLRKQLPDMSFFFQPADIINQILNFGLPAPIDVQLSGRNAQANYPVIQALQTAIAKIPGAVDVHVHQIMDLPQLQINVDRTRANQLGLTQHDVGTNVLTALSSSSQVAPNYWVNPQNGVNYFVAAQAPQYKINSVDELQSIPIIPATPLPVTSNNTLEGASSLPYTQQLSNVANVALSKTAAVVNHYNAQPAYDVYLNIQGRDLGSVSRDVAKIVANFQKKLPRGSILNMRGQVDSMNSSFTSLGLGMILAIILAYLLMVINFQSWIDPLIIMTPTPAVFSGILWMLFATQTTFNVPSLMGSVMAIGVATANSILLVSFANEQMMNGHTAAEAAHSAGVTRLRPVLMTAAAMVLGMLPMALGLGEGAEQNAPLGRAVIGGLLVATCATLFLVPMAYSWLNRNRTVFH